MAIYDLEQQEQISALKSWWEQYGTLVTGIAAAAAVVSVGWQGYNWYSNKVAAEASGMYSSVQQAIGRDDDAATRGAADALRAEHGGSVYAEFGSLLAASHLFAKGDTAQAQAALQWQVDKGSDALLRDIARLRLAAVHLSAGEHDAAIKVLEAAPDASLRARFDDLRGDVLTAAGKPADARKAYQAALDTLAAEAALGGDLFSEIIRVKVEALEG